MIEAVTSWVRNIILVVLFASFMELLLPNTSMKRFIKVIMGIFIMLAMLNPVLKFFESKGTEQHVAALGPKDNMQQTDSLNQLIESTVTKREELLKTAYKQDLARQITALVKSIGGVEDAAVNIQAPETKISKIIIYLKPGTQKNKSEVKIESIAIHKKPQQIVPQELSEKVRQTVSELYQIPPKNIEIELLS